MRKYTTEEINKRFALLAQFERRCIIRFLEETEMENVQIGDLVDHIQKQDPSPADGEKISTVLRHIHLPKLATTDVLDMDPRSEAIRYNSDDLIESLLESTPEMYKPSV